MFEFFLDDYNLIKVRYNEALLNGSLKVLCNGLDVSYSVDYDKTYLFIRLSKEYEDLDVFEVVYNDDLYKVKPRFIVQTKRFEDEYKVDLNLLGSFLEESKTIFRLWSPCSTSAYVMLNNEEIKMDYLGKGLFEKVIDKNLDGYLYSYKTIREKEYYFSDPFSFVDNDNKSYIINPKKIKKEIIKPKDKKDKIIYEINVRDFSSDETLPFENKKKLLALIEEGLTLDGKQIGLDYLADLGVSHIQLMPIFSFDLDGSDYNWGYNPVAYNTLEKSYLVSDNPYSQLSELRQVVNKLHSRDLKVNLDVVYNHVYQYKDFNLDLMLPYYFFRYRNDKLGNASLCGNETRSESYFFKEYIKLLICRMIALFDIDGLRFDLMGILDFELIDEIYEMTNYLKPGFMIYGEGWNMGDILPEEYRASMNNSYKMEHIGFFNNHFRESLRGKVIDDPKAFLLGDISLKEVVKKVLCGSGDFDLDDDQTINYVECHDNFTMYDKTLAYFEDEDLRKKVCKLALSLVVLSRGIAFIHSGQEFLRTKQAVDDSYNMGDIINKLDWYRKNENEDLCNYLSELINIRNTHDEFRNKDINISFDDYYEVLIYRLNNLTIFINPCIFDHIYNSEDNYRLLFNENGYLDEEKKAFDIPAFSIVIGIKQ